jgi:hypothetical protein
VSFLTPFGFERGEESAFFLDFLANSRSLTRKQRGFGMTSAPFFRRLRSRALTKNEVLTLTKYRVLTLTPNALTRLRFFFRSLFAGSYLLLLFRGTVGYVAIDGRLSVNLKILL